MIVKAWNNGQHRETGAGYGVKLNSADRGRYFQRAWKSVTLEIAGRGDPVVIRSVGSPSFWGSCSELRHRAIGKWLREQGMAPWSKGMPPTLKLEHIEDNRFSLTC